MPLSLENPDQRKLIDHLVNGTLNKETAKKIPGITIESEYPLKLRYKQLKKPLQNLKNS